MHRGPAAAAALAHRHVRTSHSSGLYANRAEACATAGRSSTMSSQRMRSGSRENLSRRAAPASSAVLCPAPSDTSRKGTSGFGRRGNCVLEPEARSAGARSVSAESAGRLVVPVDARNTPRTCPECEHATKENRVTQAKFACTACGFAANADHVGATNVLNRAGLVLCAAAQPPTQEARAFTHGWSHVNASSVACARGSRRSRRQSSRPRTDRAGSRRSCGLAAREHGSGDLPRQLGGPPILTRGSSLVKGVTARGSRPGDHCREITAGIRSTPPPSHSRACAPGRPRL